MPEEIGVSIVIPVYGSRDSLGPLCSRLMSTLQPLFRNDFEIIFINDGCPQGSWGEIIHLCEKYSEVKGINLSKNYGQHNAITAGLDFCNGDWTVVMDCDLQDLPEEIPKLYFKALEGFDAVLGQRVLRRDSALKKLSSSFFYSIFSWFSGLSSDNRVANFGIYSRKVINGIKIYREQHRYFPILLQLSGFKKTSIPVNHGSRHSGETSYSLKKLISLALNTIIANSNTPLLAAIYIGFMISLTTMLYSLWLFYRYFAYGVEVQGWTSLMVSILFINGLLFSFIGVLGIYIGNIFNEVKSRPLYLISETKNVNH